MSEASAERPVILGQVSAPQSFKPQTGGKPKVGLPGAAKQASRLEDRFKDIETAFAEQVVFTQSLGASDPDLVIVFEALDERLDLEKVSELLGLEILAEVEGETDPDDDFPRLGVDQTLQVSSCLHAVCIDQKAMQNVLKQWATWKKDEKLPRGYAKLRDLFSHLKDVRPWGPQDRVQLTDWAAHLDGLLPGMHDVELELWYRGSAAIRVAAEAEVKSLVESSGGVVLSSATIEAVGYHGMKANVPLDLLKQMASGNFDSIALVKSSRIMYLRATGQSPTLSGLVPPTGAVPQQLPTGDPILCLLDGVPVANHPLLAGRLVLSDPDDLASVSASSVAQRKHGTAMASACVWGDLSESSAPTQRPVVVRPILAPSPKTQDNREELPETALAPDLMRRVFRELFDGDGNSPPVADTVVVINLSVGDPGAPFDGVISAWARTIDWLSDRYGVIVVVSAGNHGPVPTPAGADAVSALAGEDRADAVNSAVAHAHPRRSILAPADSINSVTVGALNADGSGPPVLGYRFDPSDGHLMVSPLSGLGAGYRRGVKPDMIAPGGRVLFATPQPGEQHLRPITQSNLGPGILVAASDGSSNCFSVGTSPAAALTSNMAASAAETILGISPTPLSRPALAVATKALLIHSNHIPDQLMVDANLDFHAHGYGTPVRNYADGCASNEATMLFIGSLKANEKCELALPLPNGLQDQGIKRITATLAWLTPINWKHRQYRRGVLSFAKPRGFTNLPTGLGVPSAASKRGTTQHAVWEINKAVAVGQGDDLTVTVQCAEQAGGLNGGSVQFAVALSLWVAPELKVNVYEQVQQQVAAKVAIAP